MFEKETEKHCNEAICSNCGHPREGEGNCGVVCHEWRDEYDTFKEGAEFGYNKANEWHYVKDGDLPKEYDKPYLCKVYSHFEVGYFTAYKDQPWHFDKYYLDNEDVIAWKEIILPELPKESE